jgi:hypothetical protein
MDVKEQIRLDRIKLSIRSRLLDIGCHYKKAVRLAIPGATDVEFEQALRCLVENELVTVRVGNRGGEIISLVKVS